MFTTRLSATQIASAKQFLFNKKRSSPRWYQLTSSYGRCHEAYTYLREVYADEMWTVSFSSVRMQLENCDNFVRANNHLEMHHFHSPVYVVRPEVSYRNVDTGVMVAVAITNVLQCLLSWRNRR